jgi:hypothetical protein
MREFLQSIKADLISRRMFPLVALLCVAFVGAVIYAVGGGSGSSTPAPIANLPHAPVTGGIAPLPVAVAPANPNEAVSETPAGARFQSQGPTRDPFVPLPSPPVAKTATTTGSGSSSSSNTSAGTGPESSSSGAGGSSSGGSSSGGKEAPAPTPAPAPKKPTKPKFPYIVSVLFGAASTTPGQPATLTPYESLKPQQPLPSKQDLRISFERVTSNGSGAVFKLVNPPILHGSGICLPSTSECQAIDLEAGHSEELEYIEANGQSVVYELKVVSVTKTDGASASRVKHTGASASRVRRKARSK